MTNSELEKWIKSVDTKLDNHLHSVLVQITTIKTDMDWVKRTYWIIAGATLTTIIGVLAALFFK